MLVENLIQFDSRFYSISILVRLEKRTFHTPIDWPKGFDKWQCEKHRHTHNVTYIYDQMWYFRTSFLPTNKSEKKNTKKKKI